MRYVQWILAATLLTTGIALAQEHTSNHASAPNAQPQGKRAGAPVSHPVPMDATRRAGYEASRAFHKDPNSKETADAIRRLILTADGKLPAQSAAPKKTSDDD